MNPLYAPGLLIFTLLVWSMMQLEGAAVKGSQAPGVSPSTLGSSGMFVRKRSSFSLNCSTDTLLIFLMAGGRQLNSLGPFTWNDCSLSFRILGEPFKGGIQTSCPLLSLLVTLSQQFGTKSSSIFQV